MKLLLLLLIAVSCTKPPLSVFTEYVTVESLPSYIIRTPDPRLLCPDSGEKLHISWEIPTSYPLNELELRLFLRYGNGKDETFSYSLFERKGLLIFPLLNDDYWEKEGIHTFKIELYQNGTLIDTWLHQLWAERILPCE